MMGRRQRLLSGAGWEYTYIQPSRIRRWWAALDPCIREVMGEGDCSGRRSEGPMGVLECLLHRGAVMGCASNE